MPSNPNRRAQGGDVDGTESTDVGLGLQIAPLQVSKASYDTGFPVGHVMSDEGNCDGITKADLKLGYTSYGRKRVGQ
jgi:hypothetical protein